MPRKKSVKGDAGTFKARVGALDAFYDAALSSSLTDQQITWAVEAALIKLSDDAPPAPQVKLQRRRGRTLAIQRRENQVRPAGQGERHGWLGNPHDPDVGLP